MYKIQNAKKKKINNTKTNLQKKKNTKTKY